MQEITIWGRRNSVNVKKVLWIADEIGLDYKRELAGGSFGVVSTDHYQQMNPNRQVPCLKDGDFVLWESVAIVRYLARKYSLGVLMPESIQDQALVDQWHSWAQEIYKRLMPVFMGMVMTPEAKRDLSFVAIAANDLAMKLKICEQHLSEKDYLLGSEFSCADVPLGALFNRYSALDIDRPSMPHLDAWYARLQKRKAFRERVMTPSGSNPEQWAQLEKEDKGL